MALAIPAQPAEQPITSVKSIAKAPAKEQGLAVIYISETDADILRATWSSAIWQTVNSFYLTHGYPQHELIMDPVDMENFILDNDIAFTYVKQGDVLEYGNYRLICISTPGHTPGHICLYEPEHKFLIGGDHVLSQISSNITARPGFNDSLGQYLESLDKVESMDISLILPGHRNIIHDYRLRIAELKLHHMNRLAEILTILKNAPMSAYQVAGLMHWDLSYDSWEKFPNTQKWFATGEAIAHLDYLALHNKIQKRLKEERIIYEISATKIWERSCEDGIDCKRN